MLFLTPEKCIHIFFSTNPNGFISWDSVKVRQFTNSKKATAPNLTKAHIDKYSDANGAALSRVQAMIFDPNEGDVTLCFVRFTGDKEMQKEISKVIGIDDYFTKSRGYFECNDPDLINAFRKCGLIVAPPAGSLVVWNGGVVHLEANRHTLNPTIVKDSKALRYIVGTQDPSAPHQLSQSSLKQLAISAIFGFIPEPFNSSSHSHFNDGTKIGANSCHKKRTR